MKEDSDVLGSIDRRSAPRISYHSNINVCKDVHGNLLNISPNGLAFVTKNRLTKGLKITVEISLPPRKLNLDLEIKWCKESIDENFICGAVLVASEAEINLIRKVMVITEFRSVLRKVKNKDHRKYICRFAKHIKFYISGLFDLITNVESKNISEKDILGRLAELTNSIVVEGDHLSNQLSDRLLMSAIKKEFRILVSPWAYKSLIVKRSYDKPRGYPGDYRVMEAIYNKNIISPKADNLGRYFDEYFLNNPYAEAVRNRKDVLREYLRTFISSRTNVRILNIACGSCREVRELLSDINMVTSLVGKKVLISCLDWDDEALEFSKAELCKINASSVELEFVKEDIFQIFKNRDFFQKHGKYDLIYSIGLADYLPDRVIKKIVESSFNNLNVKGTLLLAHKDKEIRFSRLPPEWFCDWEFILRNQEEFIKLVASATREAFDLSIQRDATGDVFFTEIMRC